MLASCDAHLQQRAPLRYVIGNDIDHRLNRREQQQLTGVTRVRLYEIHGGMQIPHLAFDGGRIGAHVLTDAEKQDDEPVADTSTTIDTTQEQSEAAKSDSTPSESILDPISPRTAIDSYRRAVQIVDQDLARGIATAGDRAYRAYYQIAASRSGASLPTPDGLRTDLEQLGDIAEPGALVRIAVACWASETSHTKPRRVPVPGARSIDIIRILVLGWLRQRWAIEILDGKAPTQSPVSLGVWPIESTIYNLTDTRSLGGVGASRSGRAIPCPRTSANV